VGRGDRVTAYMPMVPETAFILLAVARVGAVHSVVFSGFGVHALAERIKRLRLAAVDIRGFHVQKGEEGRPASKR